MGLCGSKDESSKKSYSPGKVSGGADTSITSSPKPASEKPSTESANPASSASPASPDLLPATPVIEVSDAEYVEAVVCKETDINENEMKILPIGEDGDKVLIVKQNGQISALGTKCTHYGAPLDKSALGDGRLRCQWHGACFNIKNGDIEDFPGMDSLPCYQVYLKDGNVFVKAEKKLLKVNKRVKSPENVKETSNETYIVVGGGPAGANCVETLRQEGFAGQLYFILAEPYLPYDRIKLSKALDIKVDSITLRSTEFYESRRIRVKLGVKLEKLQTSDKEVVLSNGETLKYDKVFLATGSSPRRFPAPGLDLPNVFTLRNIEDANNIGKALTPESNVVVLGASFIGLEAAATLVGKAKSVTVVAIEAVPFQLILGEPVGLRLKALCEEKGVKFCLENGITEYKGDGKLESVVLTNGTELPADLCLIGVGVVANTEYLAEAGVSLLPNRTVQVDEFLKTEVEGVYAGGDIVTAPVLGQQASIGHWGLANYHGHIAGKNMMGLNAKLNAVPFFWTMLFGKGLRYCGYAFKFERVEIRGDLETFSFVAFYVMDTQKVAAVLTAGRDPIAAHFGELLHQGKQLEASEIDEWLAKY